MNDGCIVRMTDKDYLEKFINKVKPESFTRVIISQSIRLDKDYPDTLRLKNLFPPPYCTSINIRNDGCTDEYVEAYREYLQRPEHLTLLAILVSAVLKTGGRLALICTKAEKQFGHLRIICDLLEDIFFLKSYSLKKFLAAKEISIPNKTEISTRHNEVLEYLNKIELENKHQQNILRKKMIEDLKDRGKHWLYSYCIKKGIKAKKKYSKSKLIENIIKADETRDAVDEGPLDDDEDYDGIFDKWART